MRALAVAVGLALSSACEISRPADLHPDAVALYVLLVAGESEARMLVSHPHRDWNDPAPDITATLDGPGWTAPFVDTLEQAIQGACGLVWYGLSAPRLCLRAALPDTIRPGDVYGLRGTTPLGSFTGEMKVPAPPLLLEPADSLRLAVAEGHNNIQIPMRYQFGTDVGTLMADVVDIFEIREDGSEAKIGDQMNPFPHPVDMAAGTDTMPVTCPDRTIRFSFRVLGIGWHYTRLVELRVDYKDLLLKPWPSFGIDGEGVYGYFDGLTPSHPTRIVVDPPQTGCARP